MAIAILDIDGTLVDTNYQHAIAWYMAFRQHDVELPVWRIHRHIGMGGDQLVAALLSPEVEDREGDDIRAAEKALYLATIDQVQPLRGARALIEDLRDRGRQVVLASSAKAVEVDHYLDLLDARDLADGWTTSGDVESTKPSPDLVEAALKKLGTRQTIAGMACLALAMNGAVLLLTDLLFHATTVAIVVTCMTSLFAWLWFGHALLRRFRGIPEW